MKCGKTNLCDVEKIKGKYAVTWGSHISGLDVYSEKVYLLMDMIVQDARSWDIGVMLTNGYVLWLSKTLIATLDNRTIVDYLVRVGKVTDHNQIKGAVFDNPEDVETFVDRLEKKYIVYLLKK